ncbi:MAG: YggS family pyridoxal phosphate enzyme, partial [Chloroflexi bacterium]
MSLEENLAAVRERIARTGRNPDEITIVAVTKGFGAEVCRQAVEAGLTNLGENRVQEALAKMGEVPPAEWHLIG